MRPVNLVVTQGGHETLAQRIESQSVVHHLANHVNILLLAGELPHEHDRIGVLSLSHVAAPPGHVHRCAVGVGVLKEGGHLLVDGSLQGILEGLDGGCIGLALGSQYVTEEI